MLFFLSSLSETFRLLAAFDAVESHMCSLYPSFKPENFWDLWFYVHNLWMWDRSNEKVSWGSRQYIIVFFLKNLFFYSILSKHNWNECQFFVNKFVLWHWIRNKIGILISLFEGSQLCVLFSSHFPCFLPFFCTPCFPLVQTFQMWLKSFCAVCLWQSTKAISIWVLSGYLVIRCFNVTFNPLNLIKHRDINYLKLKSYYILISYLHISHFRIL